MKPLNERELSFYLEFTRQGRRLQPHIARFFGTKQLNCHQVSAMTASLRDGALEAKVADNVQASQETSWMARMRAHDCRDYLVLEDLAGSLARPRILDLKMGYRQRSKLHNKRKRDRCVLKALSTTSHALGFRVCGIHFEDRYFDKYWGRSLKAEQIRDVLADFFLHAHASAEERRHLVSELLRQLRAMRSVVENMLHWRFWNTSLLFVYDADHLGGVPQVRVIDFAHCTRVRSPTADVEFISALANVEAYLEALRDSHPTEWVAERLAQRPDGAAQDAEQLESDGEATPCCHHAGEVLVEAPVPVIEEAGRSREAMR